MNKLSNNKTTLKEAFRDFEIQPSDALWEKTYEGLQNTGGSFSAPKTSKRLYYYIAGGAVVVAAFIAFMLWPEAQQTVAEKPAVIAENIDAQTDKTTNTKIVNPVSDNSHENNPIETSQLDVIDKQLSDNPDQFNSNPATTELNSTPNTVTSTTQNAKAPEKTIITANTTVSNSDPDVPVANQTTPKETDVVIDKSVYCSRDTSVCSGEHVVLEAVGGDNVLWSNGERRRKIVVVPKKTSTYTVTYYFADNTSTEKKINVEVRPCLYVPNAFTPNGTTNRVFKAEGTEVYNFTMQIYSRAGAKVFESTDINYGWDGTYNGAPVTESAYLYVITFKDAAGYSHVRRGSVLIVK